MAMRHGADLPGRYSFRTMERANVIRTSKKGYYEPIFQNNKMFNCLENMGNQAI